MERQRTAEVEVERLQQLALHPADVLLRVRVVRDVDEVADLRREHLLVLGGDEHRRHAEQLQLRLRHDGRLRREEGGRVREGKKGRTNHGGGRVREGG